jgi:hypothetical protein
MIAKKWGWSKQPKGKYLVKKLDTLFSRYIRMRDTQNGYGHCITCRCIITYYNCDCGHFISRNKITTRWDERNANAQCKQCNRFLSGKQYEHGQAINRKFGDGVADLLLHSSKLGRIDHKELIDKYKEKIKQLGGF